MKIIACMLIALFSFGPGMAQEDQVEIRKDSLNDHSLPYFKLREPAGYILEKQEFTFTPELGRIHIQKLQDDQQVDYGDLRRTTDDGLYIMTSTINEDVSFGRFDSIGNFRTLRYDRKKDSVIEETYLIQQAPEKKEP